MSNFTTRPVVMGTRGVVTSGHYLASAAGFRIMEQGGNAIDAAAAMCFALNLLEPQNNGTGGEVPTLVYSASQKKTYAISGQGWSAKNFSIDWCRANNIDMIPGDGYLPACVPAVVDTWAVALAHFGTMSFAQILQPVIELAENGFPIYQNLHNYLAANRSKFFERYPTTAALYHPKGVTPETGQVWRNPDYANLLKELVAAETAKKNKGRLAAIVAARDAFYNGAIAQRIVDFIHQNPIVDSSGVARTGLLEYSDFSEWYGEIEDPVSVNYRGLDVYKCPAWTQGPVFLQQLTLLEGFDLAAMGHNSAEYLHTVVECAKLAFADREAYYGDPHFDDMPMDVLLSKEYAAHRRKLIEATASRELRPGDTGHGIPAYATFDVLADNRSALALARLAGSHVRGDGSDLPDDLRAKGHLGDTTHLDAVDREGNMVAATPSGGWIGTSPVIPGCGFPLGTRGQMFYLN
ncbi:MAG TPA: gamma-glutamyltransferase, partial [Anaerolineae bacterium]